MNSTTTTRDIDISCDWLYKGKHRSKKKLYKSNELTVQNDLETVVGNDSTRRRRSTSVSNALLSSESTTDEVIEKLPLLTPTSSIPKKEVSTPLTKIDSNSQNQKPDERKIQRSKSLNNSTGVKAGFLNNNNSAFSKKRSNSINEKTTKKSLFGSLFGRKNPVTVSKQNITPINANNRVEELITESNLNDPISPTLKEYSPTPSTTQRSVSTSSSFPIATDNLDITSLSTVSLKRVKFSVNKFTDDPPQQLPSRNPKIGNVLIPEDMIADAPAISMGITPTQPETNKNSNTTELSNVYGINSLEYKRALDIQRKALKEAAMHQKEAHLAAKRIEYEVTTFKNESSSSPHKQSTEDSSIDKDNTGNVMFHTNHLENIDKPIHMHEYHFGEEKKINEEKELTLDIIYTRCCHLREILPIPSTLKQLKGKTAPLQILKFLNAKPTLIDILSFCDFISITGINTVVFDNVDLTQEMFKILICSLAHSNNLEKISLKNVLINNKNWILFCKFLLHNKSITKLDISQTNTKHIAKDKEIPDDNEYLRHNLDWNLFANVLNEREGRPIEELLLNGIKFSNHVQIETFQHILCSFIQQKKSVRDQPAFAVRLGLASSELSINFLRYLMDWMSTTKNSAMSKTFYIQGVDFSFNDLSQYVKTMVNRLSSLDYTNLEYFTLNNSNISKCYDLALLVKYLARLPNLKFLDMSNCPQIFPDILPFLHKYLPRFTSLKRIHIDANDLPYKELSVLCNILTKCTTLRHISMIQQTPLTEHDKVNNFARNNCWSILYALVRQSPNLVNLDINYDAVPEEIQSRIALSLVSNMNRAMGSIEETDELTTQDDLLFDGSLLSDTAEQVFEKLNNLKNKSPDAEKPQFDSTKKYLLKKYFEKMHNVHDDVQNKIDIMFERRRTSELGLKEKENLVRFLLLEKNLSNVLELCSHIPEFSIIIGSNENEIKHENKHFEPSTTTEEPGNTTEGPDIETLTRPHLMATDSGRTVDCSTGKPLLFKSNSTTLVHSREQEQEEGELHKWGFFVQQQNDIYPDNNDDSTSNSRSTNSAGSSIVTSSTLPSSSTTDPAQSAKSLITKIPSGAELRSAIIQAKGIDSINDLIHNVNEDPVHLESIYGVERIKTKVGETYDKLLNDISEGRKFKK